LVKPAYADTTRLGPQVLGNDARDGGSPGVRSNSVFDSLTLNKGGTVDIAFLGETAQGTWRIDRDNDVLVDTDELYPVTRELFRQLPDGCLDGAFIGKHCKGSRGKQANGPANGFGGAYVADYEGILSLSRTERSSTT